MINNYTNIKPGSKPGKELKYRNEPVKIDGIRFDSKKEGNRYLELKEQERIGLISNLELQPEFVLQERFKHKDETIGAIKYRADFKYLKNDVEIIEDVKGTRTPIFKLKRKILLFNNPDINFIET